jgi:adenylate cyclase
MSNIFNSEHPAFEKLRYYMAERTRPGSDKPDVDQRIWKQFGEKSAVMFTDLSGFSRRTAEFGIIHFLQVIFESHKIFCPAIDRHDGLMIKADGDSMLVVFKDADRALQCAVEMQRKAYYYNRNKNDEEKILLCVGLGYGDCLRIGDDDIFGAEVNAASKLGEDTAEAWEILVTSDFKKSIEQQTPAHCFEMIDFTPPGSNENAYRLKYSLKDDEL